jgi:hypothetical protein
MNNQTTRARAAANEFFKESMTAKKQPPEQISGLEIVRRAELEVEERIQRQKAARDAVSEASALANTAPVIKQRGRRGTPAKSV